MHFLPSPVAASHSIKVLLFCAGFAILALEVLGVKILAPYVGLTLPVWGSILSTILLGSMVGYYVGGYVADKDQGGKPIALFAAISGLSIFLIPVMRKAIPSLIEELSYVHGSIIGSLVLFLLPSLILGALITYAIRLSVKDTDTIAQVHGDLYAIATIGSIAGVFVTSYLLLPFFTIPSILGGLGIVLIAAGLIAAASK